MTTLEERLRVGELLAPEVAELLQQKNNQDARDAMLLLADPEIADLIAALPPAEEALAFRVLPRARAGEVFTYLAPEVQESLLAAMTNEQMVQLVEQMPADDRAKVFEELPGAVAARVLAAMRPEERSRTQVILGYPPKSVGRIMTPAYLAIKSQWTCQQALDHIRKVGPQTESFSVLYVIDEKGRLVDDIRLRQVLLADPQAPIESLMNRQFVSLQATADREEAVSLMERYDYPLLPVVDRDQVLVGIVTFDDVADVAKLIATEEIQKMGGVEALDEPYMSVPLWTLVRKRGGWLSVLFLGELLTATAMGFFESEIERATVLALFIPLIISSGGNSGSQASTLIIRAMALGEVTLRQWWQVLWRELACGLMLGSLLGGLGVLRIHLWQWFGWMDYTVKHDGHVAGYHLVAFTVGAALVGVVMWGTLIGAMLPFLLRSLKLDPAAISAPFVATLVDVTGLIIYFTAAFLIMHAVMV